MSSKMEETEAKEAGNDIGDRHSRPPETKSNSKFTMLVEVRQVKDHLANRLVTSIVALD